jgi:hypothetical protein
MIATEEQSKASTVCTVELFKFWHLQYQAGAKLSNIPHYQAVSTLNLYTHI